MAEQKQFESGKQVQANRLLGVYPQKQDGFFMQRIRIPAGRISWPQWRRIAELAIKHTPGVPLHLTTRQDIELHDVTRELIPAVHEGLAEAALTIFGAGGDSVRNVTVCAGCDLCRDALDLLPLARFVQSYLEQQPVIFNLGRKFKISFSGCKQACARPWISDLGFIAQANGLFTVIGAGSLGPKPAPGIRFYKDFSMMGTEVSFFVEVENLFDAQIPRIINPVTGRPYEPGDIIPITWQDDPRDLPPDNPARYRWPRRVLTGLGFRF